MATPDVKNGENLSSEEDLCSRDLTELPSSVLQNRNIVNLLIDYNDIQQLPDDFGVCLPLIKFFSAIGNDLTTLPSSFGNLQHIEEIYLNENGLISLPDEMCKLTCLKKLKLTGNQLERIPENFGELCALEVLECEENLLSRLPKTFGLLENLKELELGCNAITSLSEGFGMLKSLQVLNLSSNKLNALPESFGNLPNLVMLDISANNIKTLPSEFKSVNSIVKLYADANLLQCLPDWVSKLSNIVEFSLKDNQFQHQTLPNDFPPECKKLRHLDMSGNFMSGLPESLGELKSLEFLHCGSVIGELERRNFQNGNWLATIPDSITCLSNLRELHLDENQISDLPTNFGDLKKLEILDLGQNLLHSLPDSFGNLVSLRICMLSKNHLMWLPSNIGHLQALEDLRLDDNELAELPESFSQLHKLKSLDLFSNRLAQIPTALHHLTSLVRLDIDANDFSVPLSEVPLIIPNSKYPARDPTLKDNWRGRPRQDITGLSNKVIKVEASDDLEFEPPPPSLNYNEDFLLSAMKQSLSLWKSHGDSTNGRRPARRRHGKHRRYQKVGDGDSAEDSGENSEDYNDTESGNDDVQDDDDDDFEPPVVVQINKTWSGSSPTARSPEMCKTSVSVTAMLEETECWDEELDTAPETYDNVPVYIHPTQMYYAPVENGVFTFAPHDIHEDDFIKQPVQFDVETDQFEDCDHDDTVEVAIDPVF